MGFKTIAIGNPSVGKSSILNALAGEKLFKTGKKEDTTNLTYALVKKKNKSGDYFLDTPGLSVADKILKDKAAKEICEGLRAGGKCKVLFLVTETGGRVENQDIETIKKIHDAAPEIGDKYGIIVNKVKMSMLKLLKSESGKQKLIDQILGGLPDGKKCSENNIIIFGKCDALKGKSDQIVPPETFQDSNNVTLNEFVEKIPVISINKDEVDDIKFEQSDELKEKIKDLKSELEEVIGIKKFTCEKSSQKVEDRISEGIYKRIEDNVRFRLGNNIGKEKLEEAIDELFKRDYIGKNSIFVPELFICETPFDYDKLSKHVEELANDEKFSEKDKNHWNSIRKKIKDEARERSIYEQLKKFYDNQKDHEVLVLHGYNLMDTKHSPFKKEEPHTRKHFIILNKTYGYIFNIAMEGTLNIETLNNLTKDLKETKTLLELWYGANLNEHWKIISSICCEKSAISDLLQEVLGSSIMDFIFFSKDNFPMQLEKLHENMEKIVYDLRFD